jgi:hypothetical protein
MFKVGDTIKVIGDKSSDARNNQYKIGKITYIHLFDHSKELHHYGTSLGSGGMWPEDIILYRSEPKTEIDYLDCFKDNFKDGI